MRRTTLFTVVLLATVAGGASSPASAEDAPDQPGTPPFNGGINFESDGELLPLCLNAVRITVQGNELVDVENVCVG